MVNDVLAVLVPEFLHNLVRMVDDTNFGLLKCGSLVYDGGFTDVNTECTSCGERPRTYVGGGP